jgi:hypothetical protein
MVSITIKKQKKTKTKVKSKVQSRRKIGKIVKKINKSRSRSIKKNNKSRSRSIKKKNRVKKGGSGHGENYGNYGYDGENYDDDNYGYDGENYDDNQADDQYTYGVFDFRELNQSNQQFVLNTFRKMGNQRYSHLCEYLDDEYKNFREFANDQGDNSLYYVVLYTSNNTQNLLGYLKVYDYGEINGIHTYYVSIICALTRIPDGIDGNGSNNDVFDHIKREINSTNISKLLFDRFFDELYTRHWNAPHNTVLVTVLPVPTGTIRQIVRKYGFQPYIEFTEDEDNAPFDNEEDNDQFYRNVGEEIEEYPYTLWYGYYNNEHDHPDDEEEEDEEEEDEEDEDL